MNRKMLYYAGAAALGLAIGAASKATGESPRFDHLVRNDFFAGFGGDAAALERGMKKTEATLAANPDHAEALVWHGAGVYFQGGQAFQAGDSARGMDLLTKGLAEMDRAVALEPDNGGVRIPRGAVLLASARAMSPQNPIAPGLLRRAVDDHRHMYDMRQASLDRLGPHPKGELLFALADGYSRSGEPAEAERFFRMIEEKLPGTVYAKRAARWLETRQPLPLAQTGCVGCHVEGSK